MSLKLIKPALNHNSDKRQAGFNFQTQVWLKAIFVMTPNTSGSLNSTDLLSFGLEFGPCSAANHEVPWDSTDDRYRKTNLLNLRLHASQQSDKKHLTIFIFIQMAKFWCHPMLYGCRFLQTLHACKLICTGLVEEFTYKMKLKGKTQGGVGATLSHRGK